MASSGFYVFECEDEKDYKLVLTYKASSSLFKTLFEKTKGKLAKKESINVPGSLEFIEQFEILDECKASMLPVLKRATRKQVNVVSKEVREDGIVMINHNVVNAIYRKKNKDTWLVDVIVKGQYVQK